MRIMTKEQYDAVCDIVMEQKKRIQEKDQEIKRLTKQVEFLESLIKNGVKVVIHNDDPITIDYPAVRPDDKIY